MHGFWSFSKLSPESTSEDMLEKSQITSTSKASESESKDKPNMSLPTKHPPIKMPALLGTSDSVAKAFQEKQYADLTICAGGREFPVHKVVICPQSEWFERAMSGNWKDAKAERFEIDEPPTLVEQFLDLLYYRSIPQSALIDDVSKLLAMADKYLCQAARLTCEAWLWKQIAAECDTNKKAFITGLKSFSQANDSISEKVVRMYFTVCGSRLRPLLCSQGFCLLVADLSELYKTVLGRLSGKDMENDLMVLLGSPSFCQLVANRAELCEIVVNRLSGKERENSLKELLEKESFRKLVGRHLPLCKMVFEYLGRQYLTLKGEERQLFCFNCAAVIKVDGRLQKCPSCNSEKFREVTDFLKIEDLPTANTSTRTASISLPVNSFNRTSTAERVIRGRGNCFPG